jgi:protocatechuate 3,4-dioxygenase beta subunit
VIPSGWAIGRGPIVVLLIAFAIPVATQQRTMTARIYGRVVAADSGAPVRGAALRLQIAGAPAGPVSVSTNDDGRFEIAPARADRYTLRVSKPGFVSAFAGPARRLTDAFDVMADSQLDLGEIRLQRAAVITGRVHDQNGEPIVNATVTAFQTTYSTPGMKSMLAAASATTTDLGEFRLAGLLPGKYFVGASRQTLRLEPMAQIAQNAMFFGPAEGSTTFYPGGAGPAVAIAADAGGEASGTDIMLPAVPYGRVTGVVQDAAGRPIASGGVSMRPARSEGSFSLAFSASIGPDGRFTLTNVDPGEYRLDAIAPGLASGGLSVRVGPGEVLRVVVQITPGPLLTGRVLVDGLPASVDVARMSIAVHAQREDGTPIHAGATALVEVRADGRFIVANAPRLGILRVPRLPPGTALQSVLLGGRDVTDSGFKLGDANIDGLEVHATASPSRLEGEVRGASGAPVANARVVIFSPDRAAWMRALTRRFRVTQAGRDGTFGEIGLPAGPYLAAVAADEDRDVWADPDYIEGLRPRATPFTLTEGATTKVVLQTAGFGELRHARK